MQQQKYFPALDGVRAICIILTLIHHARFKPSFINGEVGVDIFFALSGYLITMLLLREKAKNGSISRKGFYIRRFFRIAPLYFLAIAAYLPATLAAYYINGDEKGLYNYYHALPWLVTVNSELRVEEAGNLLGHAWTLGIEEKFYIVWPLIFAFILSLGRRAIIFLPLVLLFLPWHTMFRGYGGIVAGVTLALLVEQGHWRGFIQRVPAWVFAGFVALAYTVTLFIQEENWNLLVSITGAFLIASLVQNPQSQVSKLLCTDPLPWLGTLTYAMYLFHRLTGHVVEEAMTRLGIENFYLETAIVYGLTVAVSYVLYRMIEKPCIDYGRKLSGNINSAPARGGLV